MLETIRNSVPFEMTAVPRTKTNRTPAKITLVTLKAFFQKSRSLDVTLSCDVSRKTSHLLESLKGEL
ncbi:hypothetical protein DPMN_188782 [Dreissena polymorpha]|uniref:Uncharacterized protein n=1 Tax=Dreissena polymorpha TaxID=45954 RepID=A0A9D4I8V1_DREPO|nr:hypothetical protein DPMN_188689 [Dreissena polymorpha]KAH3754121.1 hypothetical protein DPMN_188782 [Dreissena polymorpha]